MRMYRANIQPIATDEFGAIPESVEEQIKKFKPKLIYIIPTFQNPTGKTLLLGATTQAGRAGEQRYGRY